MVRFVAYQNMTQRPQHYRLIIYKECAKNFSSLILNCELLKFITYTYLQICLKSSEALDKSAFFLL